MCVVWCGRVLWRKGGGWVVCLKHNTIIKKKKTFHLIVSTLFRGRCGHLKQGRLNEYGVKKKNKRKIITIYCTNFPLPFTSKMEIKIPKQSNLFIYGLKDLAN